MHASPNSFMKFFYLSCNVYIKAFYLLKTFIKSKVLTLPCPVRIYTNGSEYIASTCECFCTMSISGKPHARLLMMSDDQSSHFLASQLEQWLDGSV